MRTISSLCLLFLTTVTAQQKRGVVGGYGPRPQKPNIVLILTDDQDVELGSLNFMPKTLKAVKYQGAEFRHAYVTTPMCCPSRSSLLTGMYVHNHNVYTNNDNCSSTIWQTTYETRSFATYLSNAGYRTGYFGKYLNKYNGSYIPPGWREWGGLIMNSKYYNYSINMNGKKIKHGFDYSKDYYPDLIANDSIAFLRQSKKNSAHKPVMLTMSFPSPHGPEDSAPQYSDLFFNVTSHHIPSYDYAPNPDKQWILQVTNKMKPIHKQFTDLLMTKRLQTLQSVDAAVQRVVEELELLGELQNTYVIYTSDHGYHLGQFGLIKGKSFPFEFDVRVPFLIRGPGIDPGAVIDEIVLNIDLAPTFLDIAGVDTPPHMDGRSILPLLLSSKRKKLKWPDTFLIESSGRRETPFLDAKLRKLAAREHLRTSTTLGITPINELTPVYESTTVVLLSNDSQTEVPPIPSSTASSKVYESEEATDDDGIESDHEDDLPDLNEKVHKVRELEIEIQEEELTNQDKPPLKRDNMQLDNRVLPGFIPLYSKFERLGRECSQPNMQKPCTTNQKWFCVHDNGRWRKHKCKSIVSNSRAALDNKYRKCACFTPNGLVYKKVPIENMPKKRNFSRIKRNVGLDVTFFSEFDENIMDNSRNKRNALERVDNKMKNLRGQLNDLQLINTSAIDEQMRSRNLETNLIGDSISGCRILGRGNVNCSNLVYHNRRVWQKSRLEVNNEIQELKEKLEQLKEIRRHLKHYRPDEHEIFDRGESDFLDQIPDHTNPLPKANRRKHHKKINERFHKPPKTKIIAENTTELSISINETMTEDIKEEVTTETLKPNKHKHHKQESTLDERKNSDEIPYPPNNCHCETLDIDSEEFSSQEDIKNNRRKLDDEKMRRRARKQRKKESLDKQCSSERMNCFHHDNDHWKTVPLWTNGPFCFCMNSNNNTYSCVRTINVTHNFLYCEFTTGLMTFYNLRIDPFELQNRIDQLKPEEKSFLHDQLKDLVRCKGKSCTVNQSAISTNRIRGNIPHRTVENGFHRYRKRKLFLDQSRNGHGSHDGNYQSRHFIKLANRTNSSHIENKRPISNTSRRKRKHLAERF